MAVKLYRCSSMWAKFGPHPCWKVQKALDEKGVEYEVVKGPWPGRKGRTERTRPEGAGNSVAPLVADARGATLEPLRNESATFGLF